MSGMDSYWRRYFSRLRNESESWARDNIFLAAAMVAVPPVVVWIAHPHHEIDWAVVKVALCIYAVILVVYLAVHLPRTAKLLDEEAQGQCSFLRAQVTTLEQAQKDANHSVTRKEWLDTAEKFRKWAGPPFGERVQYQATRGVLTWYLHKPDLDSLCALTGAMLLKSPRIAATLSEQVLAQKKHSDR